MDLRNRAEASGDGHDESILNPEMPNETDLTKKEKRQIEREKLKGMGNGKTARFCRRDALHRHRRRHFGRLLLCGGRHRCAFEPDGRGLHAGGGIFQNSCRGAHRRGAAGGAAGGS